MSDGGAGGRSERVTSWTAEERRWGTVTWVVMVARRGSPGADATEPFAKPFEVVALGRRRPALGSVSKSSRHWGLTEEGSANQAARISSTIHSLAPKPGLVWSCVGTSGLLGELVSLPSQRWEPRRDPGGTAVSIGHPRRPGATQASKCGTKDTRVSRP